MNDDGSSDTESTVLWLQLESAMVDVRIPAGMEDPSACEASTGHTTCTPVETGRDGIRRASAVWHTRGPDDIAIHPVSAFPVPGLLEWSVDGSATIERAPSGAFVEEWHCLPGSAERLAAHRTESRHRLHVAGDVAVVVTDERRDTGPPPSSRSANRSAINQDGGSWRRHCRVEPGRTSMPVFDELRAHASLPCEWARMLPLEAYSSAWVLDAELASVFARDWQCVARTVDLDEVGDYACADLPVAGGGMRSIVVIGGEDSLRAFDNVCIHRGAQLLTGCGNEARVTCPYHAWAYRHDGSLIGGPYMAGSTEADGTPFGPERHRLPEVRLEVWNGFVFVNIDPDAEPLGPRLAGLDEVVCRFSTEGYVTVHAEVDVWPTNWKLLVENFMDACHVFKVHKESFGANGDYTADTEMYPGTLDCAHHRVVEADGPDLTADGDDRLEGGWRRTIVLAAVFPGFVIQLQPDWLWFLRITPVGTERVRIAWQVAVAPATLEAADDPEALVAGINALVDQVNSEDHPVVAGIRRSVDRPQFDRAPQSYLERNVYDFDRYLTTRLSG